MYDHPPRRLSGVGPDWKHPHIADMRDKRCQNVVDPVRAMDNRQMAAIARTARHECDPAFQRHGLHNRHVARRVPQVRAPFGQVGRIGDDPVEARRQRHRQTGCHVAQLGRNTTAETVHRDAFAQPRHRIVTQVDARDLGRQQPPCETKGRTAIATAHIQHPRTLIRPDRSGEKHGIHRDAVTLRHLKDFHSAAKQGIPCRIRADVLYPAHTLLPLSRISASRSSPRASS